MPQFPHLTSEEASKRLATYGKNALIGKKPPSWIAVLWDQIKSPLIFILLFALAATFYLREYIDALVISIAVIINTALGFFQEYKAQRTLEALKNFLHPSVMVIRDNKRIEIASELLVPGDCVILEEGDKIPADGTILETVNLFINEAILTGESVPVEKRLKESPEVSMGTTITSGRGVMCVTNTGMKTKIGAIAQGIEDTEEEETPLQKQVAHLAKILTFMVSLACLAIFLVGIFEGQSLVSMFTTAVAVAVAAVPEGLPAALTVILALGMQRILKRQAVVRRLVSAETLGSVTTLCVDKTGTLTEGTMKVVEVETEDKQTAALAGIFANNLLDPLEQAIWEWSKTVIPDAEKKKDISRIAEVPFDSTKKYMAVSTKEGLWVKGAPEILLAASALNAADKKKWQEKINAKAAEGYRLIGVATQKSTKTITLKDLSFVGLICIADPVRKSVASTVQTLKKAGINLKVITGDYQLTAQALLRQIGLPTTDDVCIDGASLEKMSDTDLRQRVQNLILFSRVTPQQKLRIVEALQSSGEVVGMTGDGVNDALALKKAEIAIVVKDASDVAKETADMVLLDSDLTTITNAVEEGRGMFQNIRKVTLYLLSDVFTEMSIVLASLFFHTPLAITATQILWINIITDGFPSFALTVDPKDQGLMDKPPRKQHMPIMDTELTVLALVMSGMGGLVTIVAFHTILALTHNIIYAQTFAFSLVSIKSLVYVFSSRNLSRMIWVGSPLRNIWLLGAVGLGAVLQLLAVYTPIGQKIFEVVPLSLLDWTMIVGLSSVIVVAMEIVKAVFLSRHLTT